MINTRQSSCQAITKMNSTRIGSRTFHEICRASQRRSSVYSMKVRQHGIHTHHRYLALSSSHQWVVGCLLAIGLGSAISPVFNNVHAESPASSAELTIEKTKRTTGLTKEENRASLSSQHLQVKQSWEYVLFPSPPPLVRVGGHGNTDSEMSIGIPVSMLGDLIAEK